ncbi:MAG: metallophosphoesterase [Spirochaetaceae bacterium]|jgi:Icc-related predicted phosphoesterase|nr:metallophosphoesterase [Spirochaetaceae bacterium]
MKILCISDHIDPLVYSNSIKERFKDIDVVLSAGDLPMEYLEFIVSSLNKSLFFVFGNHNLAELYRYKSSNMAVPHNWITEDTSYGFGAVHIGSKVKIEEGLIVAGLGGSRRYNRGENQYTEFQMNFEIIKLIPALIINRIFRGRFLDILLTHASPWGIHDKEDPCHRGFKAFLWFMRIFKPKYLIHGHIHLYDLADLRTTRYKDTLVVNAFSHYIIETEEK